MRFEIFRMSWFAYVAAVLVALVFWASPAQFPVVLHKLALITLGGFVGYWLDRHLFPDARTSKNCPSPWMIRRAIIVAACVVAIGIAL